MKVFKEKNKKSPMIDNLIKRLESEKIDDYDIVDSIPFDSIGISCTLENTEVYIPRNLDYTRYDINDYIRSLSSSVRTNVNLERNIYIISISGKLTEAQYYKLVKFIISCDDFCSIIDNTI